MPAERSPFIRKSNRTIHFLGSSNPSLTHSLLHESTLSLDAAIAEELANPQYKESDLNLDTGVLTYRGGWFNVGARRKLLITTIVIEDGVTRITDNEGCYPDGGEKGLFEDSINCSYVYFSNTLDEIGDCALRGCDSLETIELPLNTDIKIGKYALSKLANLKSINIPAGAEIGDYALADNTPFKTIDIPDDVVISGDGNFARNTSRSEFKFPKTSVSVATAFIALTTVVLPESVVRSDDDCFYGCSSLVV